MVLVTLACKTLPASEQEHGKKSGRTSQKHDYLYSRPLFSSPPASLTPPSSAAGYNAALM